MSEKFSLKWNDFESNITNSFSKLRTETQLFDVTLIGQDQKKVSAHRLVLSACSDFFKNILYTNTHSHPLLYLDGVDSSDIDLMLDYIYHGEVQIHQQHLDRFLEGAKKFKIEGLKPSRAENSKDIKRENQVEGVEDFIQEQTLIPWNRCSGSGNCPEDCQIVPKNVNNQSFTQKPKKERAPRVTKDSSQMKVTSNHMDIDIQQVYRKLILKEDGHFKCTVCEKTMGHKASMERHVEIHVTGLAYDCKHCGETLRSRDSLKSHIVRKHKS